MAGLVAGLAALVAASATWPIFAPVPVPAELPIRPVPLSPPARTPAKRDGVAATLLARPLFSAARRPVIASGEAALAATAAAPPVLFGTIIVSGQPRLALLSLPDAARVQSVREGGRVGPFTVAEIAVDRVLVEGPDGRLLLRMGPGRPAAPEPAPAPATNPRLPSGAQDQDE